VTGYLLSGDALIVHRDATSLGKAARVALRRGPVLARSGNWILRAVVRP
jgi:hypothetical protein